MNQVSLKVIFGVIALALGVSYFLTVTLLPELQETNMLLTAFLIDLSFYLIVLVTIKQQLKKGDVHFSALIGKTDLNVKKAIPGVLLILLHFGVLVLGILILIRLTLLTQTGSALTLELLMEPPVPAELSLLPSILKFILAVIVAPFVEEVLFRGVLLNKLALRFGIKKGLLLSSLLFMIFHINSLFIPQLILGLLLGIIYIKTKQLIYPVLAHSFNNLIPFFPNILPGGDSPDLYIDMSELISMLNVLSLVFFAVLIIFVIAIFKYAKKISSEIIPFNFNSELFR